MKMIRAAIIVLGGVTAVASRHRDPSTSKTVEKVITLLKELKDSIEKDEQNEQVAYDKYACWCETFTQKQALAITEARDQLQTFGNSILKLKGDVATYVSEIAEALSDIEENEKAQKTATSVRQKESAAFSAETTELHQALAAMEQAIQILGDATNSMALSQERARLTKGPEWGRLLESIQAVAGKIGSPHQAKQLSALQEAGTRYTPQSATIQGILKDMYANFASSLEEKTKQEAEAHRTFEDYMATKKSELLLLQEKVSKKQAQKAEAEIMLSDATQGYSDTEKQLKAHVELFDQTKPACTAKADAWAERKQLRADELAGVNAALEKLTSDEAKEIFSKAKADGVPEEFVQLSSVGGAQAGKAAKALEAAARRAKSARVASLAVDLMQGVGHFDKVLGEIDKLIDELKQEDLADQTEVDDCKKQFTEIDSKVNELGWELAKSKAKIAKLENEIEEKETEKESTIKDIEDVQKEIEDMNTTREAENTAYLNQKEDDKKAIDLLQETVEALKEYYEKNGAEVDEFKGRGTDALLQEEPTGNVSSTPPEAKFSEKDSRKTQSKGVVAILEHLIEDLQGEMDADKKGEEKAQLDYESQVKAAMTLEGELTAKKTSIEETVTELGEEKSSEEGKVTEDEGLQQNQNETLAKIKPGCDWIVENQPERRKKREIEADGLRSAKEYLAGFQPSGATLAQAKSRKHLRRAAAAVLQVSAVGGERHGA